MQPRTLVIIVTLLPFFVVNIAYLMSAGAGYVPWCVPYIEGCTTISQAGRSGSTLYFFRGTMSVHAVLMVWFWLYTLRWFDRIAPDHFTASRIIGWLGIIGAVFLILYITFLGTEGEMNRFLRRYGIIIYFTFTPMAQLLMLRLHYRLKTKNSIIAASSRVLEFQKIVLLLILLIGIISVALKYAGLKTYESENIVEWNFSVLVILYFAGMIKLWEYFRMEMKTD